MAVFGVCRHADDARVWVHPEKLAIFCPYPTTIRVRIGGGRGRGGGAWSIGTGVGCAEGGVHGLYGQRRK
jgi:hypothetical protein